MYILQVCDYLYSWIHCASAGQSLNANIPFYLLGFGDTDPRPGDDDEFVSIPDTLQDPTVLYLAYLTNLIIGLPTVLLNQLSNARKLYWMPV